MENRQGPSSRECGDEHDRKTGLRWKEPGVGSVVVPEAYWQVSRRKAFGTEIGGQLTGGPGSCGST